MVKPTGGRQFEKRASWDFARVIETHRSPRDNLIRKATVVLQNMKEDTLPIFLLYPMIDAKYRQQAEQLKSTRKLVLEKINCVIQDSRRAKPV